MNGGHLYGRIPVNIETPPIPEEAAQKMRDLVTEALRVYADALGLAHDVKTVESACIPTMDWWKITLESGNVALQIDCEALLHPRSKTDGEDSYICFLDWEGAKRQDEQPRQDAASAAGESLPDL